MSVFVMMMCVGWLLLALCIVEGVFRVAVWAAKRYPRSLLRVQAQPVRPAGGMPEKAEPGTQACKSKRALYR